MNCYANLKLQSFFHFTSQESVKPYLYWFLMRNGRKRNTATSQHLNSILPWMTWVPFYNMKLLHNYALSALEDSAIAVEKNKNTGPRAGNIAAAWQRIRQNTGIFNTTLGFFHCLLSERLFVCLLWFFPPKLYSLVSKLDMIIA